MRTRVVLAVGALALAATACGDDDDSDGGDVSEEEQPYVDALIESAAEDEGEDVELNEAQAECLAPKWVSILGADRLEEAGISPDELADDDDLDFSELGLAESDGEALYDALGECDVDFRETFIAGMTEDSDVSDEDRECLDEELDDDLLRRMLVTAFVDGEDALESDEDLMGDLFAVFAECPGVAAS